MIVTDSHPDPGRPPEGSRMIIERVGERILLGLPAVGVGKAPGSQLTFPILVALFLTVFTLMALDPEQYFKPGPGDEDSGPAGIWLLVGLFWAIDLSLFLYAINSGRRRAHIIADRRELVISQLGLFGTRQRRWPRESITAIRVGDSRINMDDSQQFELQIHHPDGGHSAVLSWWGNQDDLRWLAGRLSLTLGVEK